MPSMPDLKTRILAHSLICSLNTRFHFLDLTMDSDEELRRLLEEDELARRFYEKNDKEFIDIFGSSVILTKKFLSKYYKKMYDERTWDQMRSLAEFVKDETQKYMNDILIGCFNKSVFEEQEGIDKIAKKVIPKAYFELELFLPVNLDSLYEERKEKISEIIGDYAELDVFKDNIKLLMYAVIITSKEIREECEFEMYADHSAGGYPNERAGWLYNGKFKIGEGSWITYVIKIEALPPIGTFLTGNEPCNIMAVLQNQAIVRQIRISS